MSVITKKLLFILIILFLNVESFALVAPRSAALGGRGFVKASLRSACVVMTTVSDGLACHPASLAMLEESQFHSHFYFGSQTSYLDDVTTLLEGKGSKETVENLFTHTDEQSVDSSIEVAYRTSKWAVGLLPMDLTYYSRTRNQALPQMNLLVAQSQSVATQLGTYLGHDTFFGLQLRGVERKFIAKDFSFADVLSEGASKIFDPERQSALYIEPGFIFQPDGQDWRPQYSVMISNLGIVDHKVESFPTNGELNLGASVTAPTEIGKWQIGISSLSHSQTKNFDDTLTLGTAYSIGVTDWLASASKDSTRMGLLLRFRAMTAALIAQDHQEISLQWGVSL